MLPSWELLWPYRAVLAVDARNFGTLTSREMQQVNADIQRLLARALNSINVSAHWEYRSFGQHTGDGYVAGVDPEILPALVGCFPSALHEELTKRRAERPHERPLQLRASIHVGPLPSSGLGEPMVHTHRLLDDPVLRELLARANPEITNTVVIISQRVHEDVFQSGCIGGSALAGQFAPHLVKVKAFEQPAWVHVPGIDWRLADPAVFGTGADEPDPGPSPAGTGGGSPQPVGGGGVGPVFNQHGQKSVQAVDLTVHGSVIR
ncbi:hypothetical protein [Kitasatospora phosalacinea]|uniref:Uncharacterized protein n=1 Tax=Kitasatospora phosalacinea TaxID=2065 RepID=A0A9W6UP61_9ACTN|nr:hypothetical protein [Kitasatospora phosalacinea]GLW54837.1 hypothetical protein Kpho01_28480 [Kitasatospora phosalacinea]